MPDHHEIGGGRSGTARNPDDYNENPDVKYEILLSSIETFLGCNIFRCSFYRSLSSSYDGRLMLLGGERNNS